MYLRNEAEDSEHGGLFVKALNVKIALLLCVGFTVAVCWLVNQVSRPIPTASASMAAASNPSGVTSKTASEAPRTVTSSTTVTKGGGTAEGLRRQNPIDAARLANPVHRETPAVHTPPIAS